jgi:hypothetical protein
MCVCIHVTNTHARTHACTVPIYVLCDCDAHGIDVLCTIAFGSKGRRGVCCYTLTSLTLTHTHWYCTVTPPPSYVARDAARRADSAVAWRASGGCVRVCMRVCVLCTHVPPPPAPSDLSRFGIAAHALLPLTATDTRRARAMMVRVRRGGGGVVYCAYVHCATT